MAIIGPLFALLGRMTGRLVNTLFSWATVTLFGRVPEGRQLHVSAIALGSVLWIVVVLGIAFPAFGAFVLSFVPLADSVDDRWVRLAMLGAAVVVPMVIGGVSILMTTPEDRPKGAGGLARAVFRGYPYTLGLALALLLMLAFVPFMHLGPLLRRRTTLHMPVMVEPEDYPKVAFDVQRALDEGGWRAKPRPASWMIKLPTKVLTFFAAGAIEKMVAADLAVFEAPGVSVTLHPADMMIVASKVEGRQLRSHLAESMAFSEAHLTWSKPGNDLEDRLTILAKGLERRRLKAAAARLQLVHIEREMRKADIPFEEWEVLFRNKLLVEREVLRAEGSVVRAVSDVVSAAAPVAEAAAAAGLFNRFLGSIGNAVFSALYARLRKAS